MRVNRHSWKAFCRQERCAPSAIGGSRSAVRSPSVSSQRGMALIITLILLSVITFLAVTFLALSRREKGAVTVMTEQTTAKFAADAALDRVKAEFIAGLSAHSNAYAFGLMVSTNYINPLGFDRALGASPTNVSFQYPNGNPVTGSDALQNIANLLYNPRVPVVVTNRFFPNSNEFRFYYDLNRNRVYDTNGWQPVINPNGGFYDLAGNWTATLQPGNTLSNYFKGDPEWIGILERPELPHSSSNRFIARYAYLVVPSGRTLDVNYIHNQAKLPSRSTAEGFLRNQGVGSWEINLAGFLADLNTNFWHSDIRYTTPYQYLTNLNLESGGAAFADAFSLLRYRYGNDARTLRSVSDLFGATGVTAFGRDFVDGYTRGPLMITNWGWNVSVDTDSAMVTRPWAGADNPFHYFTTQDLFDRAKTAVGRNDITFTDRIERAGTNISSYDRTTYYRLLEQLGTDSAPDAVARTHLNYINVGGIAATNFIPWTTTDPQVAAALGRPVSEVFFTNAVDNLLRAAGYGFGVRDIPVFWRTNQGMVYQPSVHRLLQLAANIYDSMTNRVYGTASNLPTVFRPIFQNRNGDIYITNFVEVTDWRSLSGTLRSLVDTNVANAVQPGDLIFGVPLVIGAKKGLPNFNEFAMQSVFQITRKLEIQRSSPAAPPATYRTNMVYVMGISNIIGIEAWNSYRTNYTRPVDIYMTNFLTMTLTNESGVIRSFSPVMGRLLSVPNITNSVWSAYNSYNEGASFMVPLQTNFPFLAESAVLQTAPWFTTNWNAAWDATQTFPTPQWGLAITNRLQFIMVDRLTGRLIDYVHLDGLDALRNLSEEIRDPDDAIGFAGLWSTNRPRGILPQGFINQIDISLGNQGGTTVDWTGYGLGQPTGNSKDYEIDKFRVFMGLTPLKQWPSPILNSGLGTKAQVPFTPTKRISQYLTWQANDPLVHYTAGDLRYLERGDGLQPESLKSMDPPIPNIGRLNDRYRPWGGNPRQATDANKFNLALKDPLVRSSDDWQFPTNQFPTIGWLGRIHRGTPWQTVYLKASAVETNTWQNWTGNPNPADALFTQPTNDWRLFDVFTTAFNDNATRGQQSVNQSGLASWSAVFSGVVALTNASTDGELNRLTPLVRFNPWIIDPVGTDGTNSPLWQMVDGPYGINAARTNFPGGTFRHVGEVLSAAALTERSPFLNQASALQVQKGLNDAVYEWLPQQVMGLLRVGEPRFVVYSYGQTLRPVARAIISSGPYVGLCTNYQVTAEMATRAVVRVEGSPDPTQANHPIPARRYPPRVVIENFNLLPPD